MAGISEKYLGKRIVNYLKNEALVGRINQQKIQVIKTFFIVKKELYRNYYLNFGLGFGEYSRSCWTISSSD